MKYTDYELCLLNVWFVCLDTFCETEIHTPDEARKTVIYSVVLPRTMSLPL